MKGIILAGGNGKRLYPATQAISKHLIPIYDKPMIYYPLSILMLVGICEVLIITTQEDEHLYRKLLKDGKQFGISIQYAVQNQPRGLAEAFIIGENFIGSDDVCLILGDNFFYGPGMSEIIEDAMHKLTGAVIFGAFMNNPSAFGVVEFDENMKILSVEEKPLEPKSSYAVPGLYLYNNQVIQIAKEVEESERGELEITDINKKYLEKNMLDLQLLDRAITWIDTGTYKGLLEASKFVEAIQARQGIYISCIEEIAYRNGLINRDEMMAFIDNYSSSEYGEYLLKIVNEID